MQKIGDITSTATPEGEFTDGVIPQGIVPTFLLADWFNTIQRELVNTVEGAGLSLDQNDFTQVLQAVKKLANGQIDIATTEDIENGTAGKLVDAQGLKFYGRTPGEIGTFCFATPPAGWLLCDGSAVSRTTYARLFAAIGTTFGSGDGSSTFNLPNLQNEFIRGLGSGRTLGSRQQATEIGMFVGRNSGSAMFTSVLNYDSGRNSSPFGVYPTNEAAVGNTNTFYSVRPQNTALAMFIFAGV